MGQQASLTHMIRKPFSNMKKAVKAMGYHLGGGTDIPPEGLLCDGLLQSTSRWIGEASELDWII